MKGKQTALIPGNEDKVGYWLTPPDLMKQLDDEFHFDFDACPYPRPAGFNGLTEEWGMRTWANPPFNGPNTKFSAWARKAVEESANGKMAVVIYPVDSWLRIFIEGGAEIRSIGHVNWRNPEGKIRRSPHPHFLFILKPQ